jgi:hypothetical protein
MVTPTRFELIVTDNPTEKMKKKLNDPRITPVTVPEWDKDHNLHTVEDPDFEELWNDEHQRQTSP